jgi:serine/threonine-protein kinase
MSDKLLGGRYQIVEILAGGSFGQTYIAEDTHRPGNPKCVVKHLKPAISNPSSLQNARRLFRSEAETLEKLGNHDQIPRLLAYFEENQEFYLVQDFIQGHLLRAELQPGQLWTETKVYQFLQEVLNILVFVHSQGVIHRDIKPSNLIRRQQDNRLVLIDFGSVKPAWTQVITAPGKTCTTFAIGIPATIAVGTPAYMPIEQERGRPRPNSDIYALGMIGIQALTGLNPTQLLENSDTGDIIWQHQAYVSDALAFVLTKMVRYHFKDRYQTATEVLQALQLLVNPQMPTELDSDIEPVQQPSMPAEREGEEGSKDNPTVCIGGFNNNALHFFSSIPEDTPLKPQGLLAYSLAGKLSAPASFTICLAPLRLPTATSISASQPILSSLEPQAPSSNQKLTPYPHMTIGRGAGEDTCVRRFPPLSKVSVEQGELGVLSKDGEERREKFSFLVVPEKNQHRLLIWARIAAVLISVVVGYAIYLQVRPSIEKTLEQIETLIAQGKYQECANQAITVPQNSRFYTYAQSLLNECQLAQATELAAERNFKAAITEASKIPEDADYYQDAQQLIGQWSDSILEVATNTYQLGKLNDAIAIAKAIPETSPVYQKAQQGLKQWNREWEKNNSYLKAAQKALDEGRWQKAISEAKQVIDTPYWKERIKPIIQKAESEIAESKTAVTSQTKRPTKRPTRTTPRRLTRATKRPTRTTPRRLTRSAPPQPSYRWTTETVP